MGIKEATFRSKEGILPRPHGKEEKYTQTKSPLTYLRGSAALINTVTKSILGRKEFVSAYRL